VGLSIVPLSQSGSMNTRSRDAQPRTRLQPYEWLIRTAGDPQNSRYAHHRYSSQADGVIWKRPARGLNIFSRGRGRSGPLSGRINYSSLSAYGAVEDAANRNPDWTAGFPGLPVGNFNNVPVILGAN